MDYTKYHQLEKYLLREVGPKFRKTGKITPHDFFTIIIWKANRAKSKEAKRLLSKEIPLEIAVKQIAAGIYEADSNKEKMAVLINEWGFRLPIASAILAVLYPRRFTVYDIRVCNELDAFRSIHARKFEGLWNGYLEYVESVKKNTPADLSLRNKDRWLWGRSFYLQLTNDIQRGFKKAAT